MENESRSTPQGNQVCVLISGGLDSCILVEQLRKAYAKVHPLYIRTGLLWEDTELSWLRRFLEATAQAAVAPLSVLDLPMADVYGSHWGINGQNIPDGQSPDESVYLPGRNIILLSKAAVFCSMNHIGTMAIGVLKGNPFPDGSLPFLKRFGEILSTGLNFSLEVIAPFSTLSKEGVLERGGDLPLHLTFSCISPVDGYHCGDCNKCAERIKGFAYLNQVDQTEYGSKSGRKSHG
ncbi:MAG TPA: 7-cyano-7-deazaguanine synthase [Nitrospiria bacterium]|jgi:7-cyano-7-deazaguanine synthase